MTRRNSYRTTRPGRRSRREIDVNIEDGGQERRNLIKYGGPWAVTVGGGALVEGLHMVAATNTVTGSLTSLALAATGYGLTQFMRTLDVRAKADQQTRILHTVNCGAVTAGVALGTVIGLDTAATAGAWAVAGAGMSIANNLWSAFGTKAKEAKGGGKWGKLEDAIGLAKMELKEPASNGKGTVTAKVEATDGATVDEFARKIPALASALKVGAGRITHMVNDDDVSDITLRVQVADLLKEGVRWPGPSAFGTGFGDTPLPLGRYEDGEDLLLNLCGVLREPRGLETGNVEHAVAQGVNGAGKTVGNSVLVTEAATRSEVSIFLLDCAKPDQDYGHIRHAADMWITTEGDVKRFFKQLGPVIKARAAYLASKGLARWEPGCGLNFLLIICEEAADYADGDAYGKVLRTIRAAGGWVETSIQRATHDQMDTTARSNHPAGMAYGLADGAEAAYVLPPEAIEAGAYPGWGNRKPGYLYAAGMGIPQERWAVIARTYFAERDTLAAAVTAGLNVRSALDSVTADALGPLWTNRTFFTTPLLAGSTVAPAAPTLQAPAPAPELENTDGRVDLAKDDPDDDEEDVEVDEEMLAKETEEMLEMLQDLLEQDPEPGDYGDLTIEQEFPPPADDAPTLSLPSPVEASEQFTPEEGRAAILQRLHEWFASGKASFEPKELSDLWLRVALKTPRNWWNRLRSDLLEAGILEDSETYGEYDIVRDPLTEDN
ncbi:hypothetical protein ACFVTP_33020 [Streptomyces celluloflavus]|uniref:hypothetical protein n=1 Tax=Streptomyces celluloflavus TaxID=58344 RepID=UPI0036D9796B